MIVSSSGSDVVEPIGAMLGADRVIATRLVIRNGRYTGKIDFYSYGEHKAQVIREVARKEGYDLEGCYAYTDSHTDLPMLEAVGHPHVVNADRTLRRAAFAKGWPILTFTRPVSLRSRVQLGLPGRPVLTATALGAGAAAASVVWYATRRRERRGA